MFNLTRQERQVILFLIAISLFGIGVNFLLTRYPQVKTITYDIRRIDLNQVDTHALTEIPGIGRKLAERIIEYRNSKGGFEDTEELKKIKGIGESKYELIKDYFLIE